MVDLFEANLLMMCYNNIGMNFPANTPSQTDVGDTQTFSLHGGRALGNQDNYNPDRDGAIMPAPGTVVAMQVFVGSNAHSAGDLSWSLVRYSFSSDFVNKFTLMKVTIPANKIGCFTADLNDEGLHDWFEYDNLGLVATNESGSSGIMKDVNVSIFLDVQAGSKAGPYEARINF